MSTESQLETTPATHGSVAPRRWALVEADDAVRLVVWGTFGREELVAIDARLLELDDVATLTVDLTGVTALGEEGVLWLRSRHEAPAPLRVCVVAGGRLHDRLTAPGMPALRLTLE